ncbi:MarR family transcriptional regulator [Virgibacillus halophilus]|uniref:MarR family transcriptional regulator n=1 Tax=Tigheibacillus halophilus TaxID=361280 RepID=UPI003643307F
MNRPFGKDSYNDKEAIILELLTLSGKLIQKWNVEGDDEEIQWMLHHCTNPALKEVLKEITVSMLHVLEAIGQLEPVNGITISQKMNIPKGTVSKATRRLADKQLINSSTRPNNKKERIFHTTALGKELFYLHRDLHQEIEKNVIRFLSKYKQSELDILTRITQDMLETSWVDLGFDKK